MDKGDEKSEVMVSHPELALGTQTNFTRLLRSKTAKTDTSATFLEDVIKQYNEVYNETKACGEGEVVIPTIELK